MDTTRGTMLLLLLGYLLISKLAAQSYTTQNRSIVSSGVNRPFLQATPVSGAAGKPLVVVLHGDGGSGAGIRAALPIDAVAAGGATFIYPDAPGGTFEYFTAAGRSSEVRFIRDLIDLLFAESAIDRDRVFLAGFSGGGTMANVLACRMENDEIRATAINAGSLYPIDDDFTYTGNGGVSCALPATMLLWGESDSTPGVSYTIGLGIRDNVTATLNCGTGTAPFSPAPCVLYQGCQRDAGWCSIAGLGHSIWNQSATASWNFFQRQGGGLPPAEQIIYADGLQNGWQDFSWGTVDFANTQFPHQGAMAIRFDADSFEGLALAKPGAAISAAQFPELRFWIRGTAGGEQLQISLQTGATLHRDLPLAGFVNGGAIVAGSYREVVVRLADPPMSYSGPFERINIQDATGTPPVNPQVVYVDSIRLLGAAAGGHLFANGFE